MHKENQYVISGGADNWIGTNAKTLLGAKLCAARVYQYAIGGTVLIAVVRNNDYEIVASKHGREAWKNQ